eukprot:161896_1
MAQAENNDQKKVPQNICDMVSKLPLEDIDENKLKITSIRYLEEQRKNIYLPLCKQMAKSEHILSVECVRSDEADDIKNEDKEMYEKILVISSSDIDIIELEDKITMEDLSPSSLIEYTFYMNGPWFLAPMSELSLVGYRKTKFSNWKHMIENPTCEAAFKRLLNIGLITNMFDHVAFPSPQHEINDWMVKDDHGKDVVIPRPVKGLRIWNVKNRCYKQVQSHLDGAPNEKDAQKYWENMLNQFRDQRGVDYIDNLLASFKQNK